MGRQGGVTFLARGVDFDPEEPLVFSLLSGGISVCIRLALR